METLALLAWGPTGWGDKLAAGAAITIALSLATLPLGIAAGFFVALGKQSTDPLIKLSAEIYTTVFRGLPELLTLFLVYYGAQYAFSAVSKLVVGHPVEINAFLAGMVALGLVLSSYSSETFLSAFRGIPHGQYEGAYAVGLSRYLTLRLVIVPQLIRLALPGLSNLWLNLMKDTALVSVISLEEIMRQAQNAVLFTKLPFTFYLVAAFMYLGLTVLAMTGMHFLEKRAARGFVRTT